MPRQLPPKWTALVSAVFSHGGTFQVRIQYVNLFSFFSCCPGYKASCEPPAPSCMSLRKGCWANASWQQRLHRHTEHLAGSRGFAAWYHSAWGYSISLSHVWRPLIPCRNARRLHWKVTFPQALSVCDRDSPIGGSRTWVERIQQFSCAVLSVRTAPSPTSDEMCVGEPGDFWREDVVQRTKRPVNAKFAKLQI